MVSIRSAVPGEMAEVGDIRIAAYVSGGFISADSGYAPALRGLGADGNWEVLVATVPAHGSQRDPGPAHAQVERIVGTIMLQPWPHSGEVVTGPDEAEIRALAVRPEAQGQGIGRTLLRYLMRRAIELGVRHLVLCTEPSMRVAHRMYEQEGFVRLPERDWSPAPGTTLLVYGMRLTVAQAQGTKPRLPPRPFRTAPSASEPVAASTSSPSPDAPCAFAAASASARAAIWIFRKCLDIDLNTKNKITPMPKMTRNATVPG
ncbi:MAG TPA: GNAT family N-acetyltransferase [Streptosporangiaceae bacterium]|nr:GNAT family N-acetyltransferase [Streptosporangiaceae bacterium]